MASKKKTVHNKRFEVRFTKAERAMLEEGAKEMGFTASVYLRWLLREAQKGSK